MEWQGLPTRTCRRPCRAQGSVWPGDSLYVAPPRIPVLAALIVRLMRNFHCSCNPFSLYTVAMADEQTQTSRTRVIPASEYRRERWRNGLGWTREIHAHAPSGSQDWDWRLSIAEIEQDAPFSAFPGIERELVLLSGEGLRLRFDDGESHLLQPPHGRLHFAGERVVTGELVDGPTQDFNLMWRRNGCEAELHHRPLVGPMVFFTEPGTTWALHLIAGAARFDGATGLPELQAGDTALLSEPGRKRFLLDGGGELLAIRIASLPSS